MIDVLLTHSYFLRFDPKQWNNQTPYPPLATLYASAVLRRAGYDIRFVDSMFWQTPLEIKHHVDSLKPKVVFICDDGFNYLTKMCLTNMREAAFKMIEIAKASGATVIMSSSDATDHPEKYLSRGADFIIAGEVEQTLLELSGHILKEPKDFTTINGLIYLKDGKPTKSSARGNLKELDELPDAAWDLLDIASYKKAWLERAGYFSMNVATTRGCPFHCNWCAKPIYGQRYFNRSPERVVNEIKFLVDNFGVSHIWFCDDIFGLKPGWVQKFDTLMKAAGVKIKFKIQSRVDLLLKEDQITALASAGCDEAWVGAESGSQKILDAMDKGTKVEQIHQATKLMKQYGIKPCFFLQFGYLGETAEDIRSTIDMVMTLMPHDIGISVSYPLPGTVFYEKVKSQLKDKTNWTDSDELAMMFKSTFPATFYKILQRYVHAEYRKRKAISAVKNWIVQPHRNPGFALKKLGSLAYRFPQTAYMKLKMERNAKPL
jgi:radical SAM superfamily enzyme YgiQ (UPF0313 family)